MINGSRRQLRRAISAQLRNCNSLDKQIRTRVSRFLSHSMAILSVERFGFALMKAASTAAGVTLSRLLQIGIFRRDFHHRAHFAHGVEISARRKARAGSVLFPTVVNQMRRRHQIEHGRNDAAVQSWRRDLAVFWKSFFISRI